MFGYDLKGLLSVTTTAMDMPMRLRYICRTGKHPTRGHEQTFALVARNTPDIALHIANAPGFASLPDILVT
jgi:hypothetical protein